MRYQTGAIDDPLDRAGLAHLVEHVMFDQMFDGHPVSARLASITSYFNATTSLDATVFVSHAQPNHLGELLAIEANRLSARCAIDDVEFKRERNVVLNEIRERERSADVQQAIVQALYPDGHPYHRRVGGTVDSVGAATREQACAFADQHYTIGNGVLVVSGNVTRSRVEAELASSLARVTRREAPPPPVVAAPVLHPHKIEVTAPIDDPALVLAWPMPVDPKLRAKYRAILSVAASIANSQLDGTVSLIDLGDERAPMLGVIAAAAATDKDTQLVNRMGDALSSVPRLFERQDVKLLDALGFGNTQHSALFRTYAQLEDADERDPLLASFVAAGLDPQVEVHAAIDGVLELTRAEAITLSREHLRYSDATVIAVRPNVGKRSGQHVALGPKIDDREPRRITIDPSEATRPMSIELPSTVPGARTRELANGLEVVLLPITSVPTIDMRLVFRTGSSDEPAGKRGVAALAANALRWDLRYVKDLILFGTAGGLQAVKVETDRTTFSVHGTSNQLDYLFAGLRRWVRDGRYDDDTDVTLRTIKRVRETGDETAALTDAWRTAIYGSDHPYTKAGLMRLADESLAFEDAVRFRAEHFTPSNATLIVVGDFDPALADRWVDYLFADWKGGMPARTSPHAVVHPAAIATPADVTQVELTIAMPASAGARASQLVAAQMLSEIAGDVRQQIGASYDLSAHLGEARLSTSYLVRGRIDARQVVEATRLLSERLAKLRSDRAEQARLFVLARNRVVMRLGSLAESAAEIAARVEDDVDLGRAPMSDLATAVEVRNLTIDGMSDVIAELELSRAAIAMRGPADDIQRAFDVLGRKAVTVAIQPLPEGARDRATEEGAFIHDYRDTTPHGFDDPITSAQHSAFRLAFTASVGGSFATIDRAASGVTINDSCAGPSFVGGVGLAYHAVRFGLHVAYESLSGTNTLTNNADVTFHGLDIGPFIQYQLNGRFWVGIQGGARFESDVGSRTGAFLGGTIGGDLLRIKSGWLGLFGRYELVSDTEHGIATFGVGYRH
jgi:predicted Zn-dependent peptidase